jgi:DNA recombination protein RmuC
MRFQDLQQSTEARLDKIRDAVANQLSSGAKAITDLMHSNETSMEHVRSAVDMRLQTIQTSNEDKLDRMRETVDEKLQSTLEKRLGESFNQVSKRLEEVHRGLGEMQQLATGVDDLKRVLTNVKSRGTWGEVQLGALLEEILAPDQYSTNVQPKPGSHHLVEYAVRLPGNDNEPNSCVWLPIDSTFPLEDYERLIEAAEAADKDEVDKVVATFLAAVERHAKNICDKYIVPPNTTDFAIMFLPTEGLYAEVLRAPGSSAHLLHQHRIVVAGPTTLAAILSSLRIGFRTLAIQKRSSEVWEILAAVKTEFGKFGDVMAKLKKQLDTASNTVDQTQTRTRAMERQLQTVEELPPDEAAIRLGLTDGIAAIQENHAEESTQ